jgi:hypothetical protein
MADLERRHVKVGQHTSQLLKAFEWFIIGNPYQTMGAFEGQYERMDVRDFLRELTAREISYDMERSPVLNSWGLTQWSDAKNELVALDFFVKAINKCVGEWRVTTTSARAPHKLRLFDTNKDASMSDAQGKAQREALRFLTAKLLQAFGDFVRGSEGKAKLAFRTQPVNLENFLRQFQIKQEGYEWERVMDLGLGEWTKKENGEAITNFFMQAVEICLDQLRGAVV